jgi:AcrR family transcriptional regulator
MPRARSRAVGHPRRPAIAAAALTVFGRDGYARASIDDIAPEAGVSDGTI